MQLRFGGRPFILANPLKLILVFRRTHLSAAARSRFFLPGSELTVAIMDNAFRFMDVRLVTVPQSFELVGPCVNLGGPQRPETTLLSSGETLRLKTLRGTTEFISALTESPT